MKIRISIATALIGTVISTGFVRAEEAPPPAETLSVEQRLAILERRYENDQDAAASQAASGATVTAGKDGFQIKSNDGAFTLKAGGYIQSDYRAIHGATDQFLLRRVRPGLSGTLHRHTEFRLVADLANGGGTTAGPTSSLLQDAYIEYKPWAWARGRIGKFKSPVGLEQLQSDPNRLLAESSLVSQLIPNRDTGVQLSGDILDGAYAYQVAFLNGMADGASGETDSGDDKDIAARVFIIPFKSAASEWINGLGVGVGGTTGDQTGSATASNLTSGYRTDGQQTFFTYQSGTSANGRRKRIVPQASWYTSHVGLLWEYAASSHDVRRVNVSTRTATLTHRAWQVAGSVVLTGERPTYNGVKPRRPFDPKTGGWGALELAGRYAIFRADDDTFANGGFFANPSASPRKARSWLAGLNWYLNNNVRAVANYGATSFDGGAAAGQNRLTEKVAIARIQASY